MKPRMDGIAPAMLTIEEKTVPLTERPWLDDPTSLDAQIALAREMWHVRLLACDGDATDPTLIALSEIIIRLMRMPPVGPYSYEVIDPDADGGKHYRIRDAKDNRVGTCYEEDNARMLVAALNGTPGKNPLRNTVRERNARQAGQWWPTEPVKGIEPAHHADMLVSVSPQFMGVIADPRHRRLGSIGHPADIGTDFAWFARWYLA